MDSPLRISPGEPPTGPPVLAVQAARTFATLAWMETALEEERSEIERRHVALLKKFEGHLGTELERQEEKAKTYGNPPGAIARLSDRLPGVVEGAESPPGEEPISAMPKSHWQPEQHRKLEHDCQVTEPTAMPNASARGSSKNSDGRGSLRRMQSRKMDQIVGKTDTYEIETFGFIGRLEAIVKSTRFEMLFSGMILANTIVMCFEAQYRGYDTGNEIQYSAAYSTSTSQAWPGAGDVFVMMEWFFGSVFVVELVLKIIGLRKEFVYDGWNGIDSVIVMSWLFTALRAVRLPMSPVIMRLCRLARLLRLLRLVRTIRGFDKLYLITTAMKGSGSILLWSMTLLTVMQAMLALFFQAILEPYILENNPETRTARLEVYKFYGTFARNILTMFELTLGNWMPPTRALVENVNEWFMLFFLSHKLVIGFALVAVLYGVFIQETFRVAAMDDKVMMLQRERTLKAHSGKMHELFVHADQDGNGALDKEEFIEALETPAIKQWLAAMELDVSDAARIFDLVDIDGDGELTAEELVIGAGRLKGAARSIDVVCMIRDQKELQREILELKRAIGLIGRGPARAAAVVYP